MKILSASLPLSIILLAAISIITISCGDDESGATPEPVIDSFTPASALPGESVTISGENFANTAFGNQVAFNGVAATVNTGTSTELIVTVPETATTGKIKVSVNGKTATSSMDFTVLRTSISNFDPVQGTVGTTVMINGSNFSAVLSENIVKFNGADAIVSAATSTQLTVSVPAAATSGKITVTINGNTSTSEDDFTVPAPVIDRHFPSIASPGIAVEITGANFSSVAINNVVKFNGTDAVVTEATSNKLTVTVPAGATTGLITVKVGPHTAESAETFEICNGSTELFISDVNLTNTGGSTSYLVSFKVTNVGAANVDLTKMGMQNYASVDQAVGNDVAASGFTLSSAPVLLPGESYTTPNFSCSIVGGNTSSHPYLFINLKESLDGTVPECNLENNVAIVPFQ